jgi:hypothetical protein
MELNDYYDDELLPGIHLLMPNISDSPPCDASTSDDHAGMMCGPSWINGEVHLIWPSHDGPIMGLVTLVT